MIYSPKLFLVAVGLPLASSFGIIPDGGSVSLAVENSDGGAGGLNGAFRPRHPSRCEGANHKKCEGDFVMKEWPTDVCTGIDTKYKPITDPEVYCASKKTPEDCEPDGLGLTLLQAAGKMTATGKAVVYDVCNWHYTWVNKKGEHKPQCRAASMSYYCHATCPNVPADRAFRAVKCRTVTSDGAPCDMEVPEPMCYEECKADDAQVELQIKPKKTTVKQPGGIDGSSGVDGNKKWVTIEITNNVLVQGRRRLVVAKSEMEQLSQPTTRRKLQQECTPYVDVDGKSQTCCLTGTSGAPVGDAFWTNTIYNTDSTGARTTDIVVDGQMQTLIFCGLINQADYQICQCSEPYTEVVAGSTEDLYNCPASGPVLWGGSGFKKTGRTSLRTGDTVDNPSIAV